MTAGWELAVLVAVWVPPAALFVYALALADRRCRQLDAVTAEHYLVRASSSGFRPTCAAGCGRFPCDTAVAAIERV